MDPRSHTDRRGYTLVEVVFAFTLSAAMLGGLVFLTGALVQGASRDRVLPQPVAVLPNGVAPGVPFTAQAVRLAPSYEALERASDLVARFWLAARHADVACVVVGRMPRWTPNPPPSSINIGPLPAPALVSNDALANHFVARTHEIARASGYLLVWPDAAGAWSVILLRNNGELVAVLSYGRRTVNLRSIHRGSQGGETVPGSLHTVTLHLNTVIVGGNLFNNYTFVVPDEEVPPEHYAFDPQIVDYRQETSASSWGRREPAGAFIRLPDPYATPNAGASLATGGERFRFFLPFFL